MPILRINQEDIHYVREGQGPALVLIHSLGTCGALWRDAIDHWKGRHTVIAMDCRGHGQSSNHGGVTLQAVAADLHGLLRALEVDRADVVGLSMGGPIAAWLHARAPRLVRNLVLANTFMRIPQGEERAAALADKLAGLPMDAFAREYAAQTLLPSTPAARHEQLAGWIAGMSPRSYLETGRSIFAQDVGGILATLRVPALVLSGEHDPRTPPAMAAEIAEQIPGAWLQVLPAAGHLSNLDNPAAFHAAVDQFLLREAVAEAAAFPR